MIVMILPESLPGLPELFAVLQILLIESQPVLHMVLREPLPVLAEFLPGLSGFLPVTSTLFAESLPGFPESLGTIQAVPSE